MAKPADSLKGEPPVFVFCRSLIWQLYSPYFCKNFWAMQHLQWQDYITSDPEILFGKPIIKGTRVPVHLILEKLGKGETIDQLLSAYPRLTAESIYACLIFAANAVESEAIIAIAA
jgi:uncharacterized protein (DUF433 family)